MLYEVITVRMSSQTTMLSREGTANILEIIDVMGALPTRNFQSGQFDQAANISGSAFRENHWKKEYACFGCPIGCGKCVTTSYSIHYTKLYDGGHVG